MNETQPQNPSFWKAALKKIAPMLCGAAIVIAVLGLWGDSISLDIILEYTPQNMGLAILLLLMAYALKSLTLVVPLTILYLVGSILFPAPLALLINTIGLCITVTLPYLRGYYSDDGELLDQLSKKFPKLENVKRFRKHNDFYFAFMVRVMGLFSCDMVSLYMGAARLNYRHYLAGCVLGFLPGLITTTLIGSTANDIHSPAFWISLAAKLLVILTAFGIFWRNRFELEGTAKE